MRIKVKTLLYQYARNLRSVVQKPLLSIIVVLIKKRIIDPEAVYSVFSKYGFYFLKKSHYLPIPDEGDLTYAYSKQSELVGLDMNESYALDLLDNVILKYKSEFNAFPVNKTDDDSVYYLLNGNYMAIDGNVYYSLIRHLKPNKIIEIGSGFSTRLACNAISKNIQESNSKTQLICIEPHPREMLKDNLPKFLELKVSKVQDVGLDMFESLRAGDILFIDSSHALRTGGDVWWEYCEILPRLASGVYVHIHDIHLPKPYPRHYFNQHTYWNEQYLLQAFLTFNPKFEVIWPGNYLMTKYPEKIRKAFLPEYDLMLSKYSFAEPASFWMRVQ